MSLTDRNQSIDLAGFYVRGTLTVKELNTPKALTSL